MYYISDNLFFAKDFTELTELRVGDVLNYTIEMRPSGYNPSTKSLYSYEKIYSGRLTVLGGTQRIFLNDIISSHMYDYEYHKPDFPHELDLIGSSPTKLGSPKNPKFFVDVRINFPSISWSREIENILQYHQDNVKRGEEPNLNNLYNVLNQRTNILPRVPRLSTKADKFWFSVSLITKYDWSATTKYKLHGYKNGRYGNTKTINVASPNIIRNYGSLDYMELTGTQFTMDDGMSDFEADSLYASLNDNYIKIADIDDCPADYYLIWVDRTGAYQCQPFNKKVTLQEDITKTSIVDSLDNSRPVNVSINNKWTLNSDWLSKEEYQAYESIFVSPYLYLYYPADDRGWWVNCDSKTWTSKTKFDKKLHNLSVTLSSIAPQNIIY